MFTTVRQKKKKMLYCPQRPTLKCGKSGSGFFVQKKKESSKEKKKSQFCGNNLVLNPKLIFKYNR